MVALAFFSHVGDAFYCFGKTGHCNAFFDKNASASADLTVLPTTDATLMVEADLNLVDCALLWRFVFTML